MRIIARNRLVAFWSKYPATEASLRYWYEIAAAAAWRSPLDAVAAFPKAKSLDGERMRFEVAGGNYRMVVAFDWRRSIAFVKFLGTHADYDRIDALTIDRACAKGIPMRIHPIRTDEDHDAALREIESLWGAEAGSEAGDRLDVLATLVDTYERGRWPIEPLDPIAAIEAAMAMNGHTRAELAALIGQSRATEILGRRRALTLPMIRKIARAWHVPAAVLVQEYALAAR